MRHALLIIFMLFVSLLGSASASNDDETAIKSLLIQRNEIFNSQEYEKLTPLFAKDVQAARATIIAKHKDNWKAKKLTTTNQSVETIDIRGDKASAVQHYETNGASKTERISFIKEADGWKIENISQ